MGTEGSHSWRAQLGQYCSPDRLDPTHLPTEDMGNAHLVIIDDVCEVVRGPPITLDQHRVHCGLVVGKGEMAVDKIMQLDGCPRHSKAHSEWSSFGP